MSVTNPKKKPRRRPQPYAVDAFFVVRTFLLASFSVVAAVYALWRYYTHPRPIWGSLTGSSFTPAGTGASPSTVADAGDAGEIPAPEIEITPP